VPDDLKKSPLESAHLALGARLIGFGGWNMPVQYSSILDEHAAVRNGAGIFDISHMGQIFVSGPLATEWLNRMLTNNLDKLAPGQGQYTLMLNDEGGVIDDLIAYRMNQDEFLLIVNASKIDEDFRWLFAHQHAEVGLRNESDLWAAMAVQGPDAAATFARVFPSRNLPPRNGVATFEDGGDPIILCRTGYTGEDGFELLCRADQGIRRFEAFIEAGAKPCGLGARDTLRLEMGFPLNGSDLSPDKTPLEAGLGFFVDLGKAEFIGRDALVHQKENGLPTKLVALRYLEKGAPPRAHYPVVTPEGQFLGELTSGVLSPSLGTGIAMAYLPAASTKIGTPVLIDIRGRYFPAKVVKKPFYQPS
jgi:aminomethyltransferase